VKNQFDAIIVGAGIGGVYSLYKLRAMGLLVRVLEAGSGVGGTWYWNCYPGARCDADSLDYSFSFSEELQQEWTWSERFASQPEILKYINHVVDRFDLRQHFSFNSRVNAAHYDENNRLWRVQTDKDVLLTRYLVMATGVLSAPVSLNISGLNDFRGAKYFTSMWPKDPVSFENRRVAIIGTGSSAIQALPVIAREASHVTVFQRTPKYSVPAQNGPIAPQWLAEYKARYAEIRAKERESALATCWSAFEINEKSALEVSSQERQREYESRWNRGGPGFMISFRDLLTDLDANRTAADFIRRKIEGIVKDRGKIRKLMPPESQPIACKRLCVDIGYFETFNRDNVDIVDLREDPIETIEPTGVRTRSASFDVDVLILATGFDAFDGALRPIDIRGIGGLALSDKWKDGPRSYLGIVASGFPNLMTINGPLTSMGNYMTSTEMAVDWMTELIRFAEQRSFRAIDATQEAEEAWVTRVKRAADGLVALNGCNSYFVGANVPGKPRVFLGYAGGIGEFGAHCAEIARSGYPGFEFR
jgi:cation diffusion facilitator CzcD-associated flavoprotein CzcO